MLTQDLAEEKREVVFIGSVVPDFLKDDIGIISYAAQYYQEKVMMAYPFDKTISINYDECEDRFDQVGNDLYLILNKGTKINNIFKSVKAVLKPVGKYERVVFYNLNYRTFLLLEALKRIKGCKCYVIVADYESLQATESFGRKSLQFFINGIIRRSAGVLALNRNIKIHSNTVYQEALINDDPDEEKLIATSAISKNTILFSGSIGITTGIDVAIAAMNFLPDYKLFITGQLFDISETDLLNMLKQNQHNNIEYNGVLDKSEYLKLLSTCEYALSLRNVNDTKHQFNFPSKITEYLSFNKKVISSIDYDAVNDLIYVIDYTPESLASMIKEKSFAVVNTRDTVIKRFGFYTFKKNLDKLMSDQ